MYGYHATLLQSVRFNARSFRKVAGDFQQILLILCVMYLCQTQGSSVELNLWRLSHLPTSSILPSQSVKSLRLQQRHRCRWCRSMILLVSQINHPVSWVSIILVLLTLGWNQVVACTALLIYFCHDGTFSLQLGKLSLQSLHVLLTVRTVRCCQSLVLEQMQAEAVV